MSNKIRCICGSLIMEKSLNRHQKTKKHFINLNKINTNPKPKNITLKGVNLECGINGKYIPDKLKIEKMWEYIRDTNRNNDLNPIDITLNYNTESDYFELKPNIN